MKLSAEFEWNLEEERNDARNYSERPKTETRADNKPAPKRKKLKKDGWGVANGSIDQNIDHFSLFAVF